MNFARYHDTVAGLSAIAQKVLECVPIQTHWTAPQITAELYRLYGSSPSLHVIEGCLACLIDSKLAQKHGNMYSRKAPPMKKEPPKLCPPPEKEPSMPSTQQLPATTDDKLSVDKQLLALCEEAAEMARTMQRFVSKLENVALQVAEQAERHKEETSLLAHLRFFLKDKE